MSEIEEMSLRGAQALHAIEDSWNDYEWEYLTANVQELFKAQAMAVIAALPASPSIEAEIARLQEQEA